MEKLAHGIAVVIGVIIWNLTHNMIIAVPVALATEAIVVVLLVAASGAKKQRAEQLAAWMAGGEAAPPPPAF